MNFHLKTRVWDVTNKCYIFPAKLILNDGVVDTIYNASGIEINIGCKNYIVEYNTPFKDRTNVEIYTGDVIQDTHGNHWLVYFCKVTGQVKMRNKIVSKPLFQDVPTSKIVTNIHESTEVTVKNLLTGEVEAGSDIEMVDSIFIKHLIKYKFHYSGKYGMNDQQKKYLSKEDDGGYTLCDNTNGTAILKEFQNFNALEEYLQRGFKNDSYGYTI